MSTISHRSCIISGNLMLGLEFYPYFCLKYHSPILMTVWSTTECITELIGMVASEYYYTDKTIIRNN